MRLLKRLLAEWLQEWLVPPVVVHHPETKYHGAIAESDWALLRGDMAKGYSDHPAFFKAIHICLRNEEKAASQPPSYNDKESYSEAFAKWQQEVTRHAYQADILRYVLRLPIKATEQLVNEKAKEEKSKNVEQSMSYP